MNTSSGEMNTSDQSRMTNRSAEVLALRRRLDSNRHALELSDRWTITLPRRSLRSSVRLPPAYRVPKNPKFKPHIKRLPDELLQKIVSILDTRSLVRLSQANLQVGRVAQAELYKEITIEETAAQTGNAGTLVALLRTLKAAPDLASHVRSLTIGRITSSFGPEEIRYWAAAAIEADVRSGKGYNSIYAPDAVPLFEFLLSHARAGSQGSIHCIILSLILLHVPNLRILKVVEDVDHGIFQGAKYDLVKSLQQKLSKFRCLEVRRRSNLYNTPNSCRHWRIRVEELSLILDGDYDQHFRGHLFLKHPRTWDIIPSITKLYIRAKPLTPLTFKRLVTSYPNVSDFEFDCIPSKDDFHDAAPATHDEISRELLPWVPKLQYIRICIKTLSDPGTADGPEPHLHTLRAAINFAFFRNKQYDAVKQLSFAVDELTVSRNEQGIVSDNLPQAESASDL